MSDNRIQQITPSINENSEYHLIARKVLDNWRFILAFAFACAIIAGAVSFLLPNRYTATATILPTSNNGGSGGLLPLAESVPGIDLSALGSAEKSPSMLYPEILSSRLIAQKVLDHPYVYKNKDRWLTQNLYQYLNIKNPDLAVIAMTKIVDVSSDRKTGVLTINVTTTNPQLSAQVANFYLDCLDNFNQNQRKTNAGQNRQFIEKRLAETKSELGIAEDNLKTLRQRNLNYYSATDPELAMLNAQLQREVNVKSQVYLTLCQQYELASIQEKKELPVIQILDSAQPPTVKSGPARIKTTLIGFIMGLFAALALLALEKRNPGFRQNLTTRLSIRRLNFIRKGNAGGVSAYDHVEQH